MLFGLFRSTSTPLASRATPPSCEPLEERRILSAALPCELDTDDRSSRADFMPLVRTNRAHALSLVGKYRGPLNLDRPARSVRVTLVIDRHAADGRIRGTVSSRFLGPIDFSAKATVDEDGAITVPFAKRRFGLTGTIEATRDADTGGLDGTFTVNVQKVGQRAKLTGTFSLKKIA